MKFGEGDENGMTHVPHHRGAAAPGEIQRPQEPWSEELSYEEQARNFPASFPFPLLRFDSLPLSQPS
eukprot:3923296-Rhodomonas_salina.3